MNEGSFIAARPFNYPFDGRFQSSSTALLVIDLQTDFLSQDGYYAKKGYDPKPLRTIIPNVNALIAAARRTGCKIVHTRQGYRADMADMTPYERWRRIRGELAGTQVLLRSSPGFQIVPEIDVQAGDIIVDKTANGAFTYTDLEHILRAQGVVHLIFAGCTTDVCVNSTLREAADRNFQCLLVEDACASGDQYAHEAAIHMVTVEDGIFGAVTNTAAVIAGMDAFGRSATRVQSSGGM